jgi:hypothetical protein
MHLFDPFLDHDYLPQTPPNKEEQDASNSVAAPTLHCFVTLMLLALVVSVNPAVWLVNDPLIEPAVRAV